MKEKFNNLKGHIIKGLKNLAGHIKGIPGAIRGRIRYMSRKTIFIMLGVILLLGLVITAVVKKAVTPPATMENAKVKLGDYEGIKLTLTEPKTTDAKEAAQWFIHYYNENPASSRTVIEAGDTVYVTSEAKDKSTAEGPSGYITIGAGDTFDEIEQGLIGMETGTTAEISVKLPGKKTATFLVAPQSIKGEELSLDTLTDAQAKEAFGTDSVEDFYKMAEEYMESASENTKRSEAYEGICESLLGTCSVESFPELELEKRLGKYIEETQKSCSEYYGMTFAEYCESMGMTQEEYEESLVESLKKQITLELIFEAIGNKEGIEYDEDEYRAYIDGLIADNGYESEEDVYEDQGEAAVKRAYQNELVASWLIENADITYMPAREPVNDEMPASEK